MELDLSFHDIVAEAIKADPETILRIERANGVGRMYKVVVVLKDAFILIDKDKRCAIVPFGSISELDLYTGNVAADGFPLKVVDYTEYLLADDDYVVKLTAEKNKEKADANSKKILAWKQDSGFKQFAEEKRATLAAIATSKKVLGQSGSESPSSQDAKAKPETSKDGDGSPK
jgi:hypothetical protein